MSVISSAAGYVSVADDCGTSNRDYMLHGWFWTPSLLTYSVVISGENIASTNNSRSLNLAASGSIQARENDDGVTVSANGGTTSPEAYGTNAWYCGAAIFRTSTLRKVSPNAGPLSQSVSSSEPTTPFTYLKLGSNVNVRTAGVSIWDISAMTDAEALTLSQRLGGPDDLEIDDPRTINEEAGQVWTGKLTHFWRLEDVTDLDDLVGSADFTATESGGYPQTGTDGTNPINPPYRTYGVPTIASSSVDPLVEGTNAVLTGTNHEIGGVDPTSVVIGPTTQTIVSATQTTTTITPVLGVRLYGERYSVVLTNTLTEASDGEFQLAMVPAATEAYTNITETPPADNDPPIRIAATPDITIGSQVHYRTLISNVGGDSATVSISYVTVQANGAVSFDSANVTMPCSLQVRVNHDDGEGWSAFETLDFDTAGGDPEPELVGASESYFIAQAGEPFTATLGQLVTSGDWTWTVQSGSLPGGLVLEQDGDITGVPTVIGAYVAVIRVTGTLTYIDLTVYFVITQEAITTPTGRRSGDDEQIRAEDAMVIGLIKEFLAMMTKGA